MRHNFYLCKDESSILSKEKEGLQGDLINAENQLDEARSIVAFLQPATESFIFPGDYKAQGIGGKESAQIDVLISSIEDKNTRINAEFGWSEFKNTLELGRFFGFLRGSLGSLANSLNRQAPSHPEQ